jgi:transposase
MDNARFHRKEALFEIIKKFNNFFGSAISIIFLPPYSPDFNPIEKWFGTLKGKVKRLSYKGNTVLDRLKGVLEI